MEGGMMAPNEFEILKDIISDIKNDLKNSLSEFKLDVNAKFESMEKKMDDFISNHPKVCFYLTSQKKRWSQAGKVLAVLGIIAAAPAFVLGIIDIIKFMGVK